MDHEPNRQFSGILDEPWLQGISIDRFDGSNLNSVVYFLSHCHTDHMRGLDNYRFRERLLKTEVARLYCTEITAKFLRSSAKYSALDSKVTSLKIFQPESIVVPNQSTRDEYHITVTLFPAGHCPGSVMFFIEAESANVLFTGDIRLDKENFVSYKALHDGKRLKRIQRLYLDATFCHPDFMFLPNREESCEKAVCVVKEWISRGKGYHVYLSCAGRFGAEYLFIELYRQIGLQIHVNPLKYYDYQGIQGLEESVTLDRNSQIHSCCEQYDGGHLNTAANKYQFTLSNSSLPCAKNVNVMIIRPTTQWFVHADRKEIHVRDDRRTPVIDRICYSMHSSCEELIDIVQYLNPKHVSFIARPPNEEISDDDMVKILRGGKRYVSSIESYHSYESQSYFNLDQRNQSSEEVSANEEFSSQSSTQSEIAFQLSPSPAKDAGLLSTPVHCKTPILINDASAFVKKDIRTPEVCVTPKHNVWNFRISPSSTSGSSGVGSTPGSREKVETLSAATACDLKTVATRKLVFDEEEVIEPKVTIPEDRVNRNNVELDEVVSNKQVLNASNSSISKHVKGGTISTPIGSVFAFTSEAKIDFDHLNNTKQCEEGPVEVTTIVKNVLAPPSDHVNFSRPPSFSSTATSPDSQNTDVAKTMGMSVDCSFSSDFHKFSSGNAVCTDQPKTDTKATEKVTETNNNTPDEIFPIASGKKSVVVQSKPSFVHGSSSHLTKPSKVFSNSIFGFPIPSGSKSATPVNHRILEPKLSSISNGGSDSVSRRLPKWFVDQVPIVKPVVKKRAPAPKRKSSESYFAPSSSRLTKSRTVSVQDVQTIANASSYSKRVMQESADVGIPESPYIFKCDNSEAVEIRTPESGSNRVVISSTEKESIPDLVIPANYDKNVRPISSEEIPRPQNHTDFGGNSFQDSVSISERHSATVIIAEVHPAPRTESVLVSGIEQSYVTRTPECNAVLSSIFGDKPTSAIKTLPPLNRNFTSVSKAPAVFGSVISKSNTTLPVSIPKVDVSGCKENRRSLVHSNPSALEVLQRLCGD